MDGASDRYRRFGGRVRWVFPTVAIGFCLFYLLYLWGVFDDPSHYIAAVQFLYLTVALSAIYTICCIPASKNAPRNRLPWYDILLVLAVIPTTVYLWNNWFQLKFTVIDFGIFQIAMMVPTFIAFMEAVRRVVGWIMPLIGMLALAYIFISPYLPGILESRVRGFPAVVEAMFVGQDGIYGNIMHLIVYVISVVFIFGAFLRVMGGEKYFTEFALSVAGRQRGGAAKVAVIGSGLFGMLSGSGVANVATTGMITIPMMKDSGQKPEFAAGVEAVASTGGTFMPPVMGAIAFLMADFLGMSYWSVCVAALVPALLFYFIEFLQVHLMSAKMNIAPATLGNIPSPLQVMKKGWTIGFPILTLVYFLAVRGWSVQTAFLYSLIILVAVAFIYKDTRPNLGKFIKAFEEGGKAILTFIPIMVVVGVILASVNVTGLGVRVTHTLSSLGSDNIVLLLLLALVSAFIMGMAVSGIAVYVLLGIFIAPGVVAALDVEPISVHLFLMYIASTSMITPPVCLAVYVASNIAGSKLWPTGFEAVRLGLGMYILPFAFIANRSLLLIGSPAEIAVGIISTLASCVAIAAGAQGYFFFARINYGYRALLFLGGLAMFVPIVMVKVIAAAVLVAVAGTIFLTWRRKRSLNESVMAIAQSVADPPDD